MSYVGLGLQGGTHLCLPFYERMIQCIRGEVLPNKMCTHEVEDFLECNNRNKQSMLNYKVYMELHKFKLLQIPRYDETNDRFVVDPALQTADQLFEQK